MIGGTDCKAATKRSATADYALGYFIDGRKPESPGSAP
jgi:hypothetical protein